MSYDSEILQYLNLLILSYAFVQRPSFIFLYIGWCNISLVDCIKLGFHCVPLSSRPLSLNIGTSVVHLAIGPESLSCVQP